jgi:hypothetical protein
MMCEMTGAASAHRKLGIARSSACCIPTEGLPSRSHSRAARGSISAAISAAASVFAGVVGTMAANITMITPIHDTPVGGSTA